MQGLALELADPLGGDAVLGADVGELVLAAVDEPVAGADDVGRAVVEAFGREVLTEEGEMDRPQVGAIVFGDEEKRRVLEGIIHPLVRERSAELEAAAGPDDLVVHDIPLLAEAGLAKAFEAVIVVDAPHEVQVERMMRDRGLTREEAESRIAAQASREERLAVATYVIDNTGTLEELRQRVEEVFQQLTTP